jgi:hypothetical protein
MLENTLPRRVLLVAGGAAAVGAATACTEGEPSPASDHETESDRRIQYFIDLKHRGLLIDIKPGDPDFDRVGGVWRSQELADGEVLVVTTPQYELAAEARGDEDILGVLFATPRGSQPPQDQRNPAGWHMIDFVQEPGPDGLYRATLDFAKIGIRPGSQIPIGFDVATRPRETAPGKIKEQPQGADQVLWKPKPLSSAPVRRRSLVAPLRMG